MDRVPKYFPIADCREGFYSVFTALNDGTGVSISRLRSIVAFNVPPSQLWCLKTSPEDCPCGNKRTHIEGVNAPLGTIVNDFNGECRYLKAGDPSSSPSVSLTVRNSFDCLLFIWCLIIPG